ncbi:hypothetical protein LUZ60_001833 [Juncus effusus]|nr:hypothetical protein LUZ60_001833 [Juncus effusus]
MVVNGRPLKRAKSRVAADLIPHNQPIDLDAIADLRDARRPSDLIGSIDLIAPRGVLDLDSIAPDGDVGRSFRESVRALFSKYGRMMQSPGVEGGAWMVMVRVGGVEVELCVVDEDVVRGKSVYCDQCKVVGWSGHPVCAKRYHFIIRNENRSAATTAALSSCPRTGCVHCGSTLLVSESRCMTCKLEGRGTDHDSSIQLDDVSHLLHAVVHSNGYGHLLRVNGHQGGSKHLTGRHIMSFWDLLCKFLHVRKVTVMDISKKHRMEYRLLHSVTTGHPWYGEWGYQFGAGSYGVNASSYHEAVEFLSNLPLSLFSSQNRSPRTQLHDLISLYKSLSPQELTTVRDLFKYITNLLHESNTPFKLLKTSSSVSCDIRGDCDGVEAVKSGMVKVLRAVGGGKWVGWRALRGATSKAAKSGEVLDQSLKELGGRTTEDGFVVAARCNSQTNTLEYRLEPAPNHQSVLDSTAFSKPSPSQLLRDLKLLFNSLLNPSTSEPYKPLSTRALALKSASIILDCKQFLKSYNDPLSNPLPLNPFMLHVWCVVELIDYPNDYTNPPPELLVISASATISDLKLQTGRIFQEIYPVFQGFHAESVVTNTTTSESALVKHVVNPNEVIRVRGRCLGLGGEKLGLYRMERGLENWTVDCECGARDDDGERMMACDTCGVWQHTRCSGIKDSDDVPAVFVCVKCVRKKNKGKEKEMEVEKKCGNVNSKKVGMVSECVYNV